MRDELRYSYGYNKITLSLASLGIGSIDFSGGKVKGDENPITYDFVTLLWMWNIMSNYILFLI